MHNNTTNTLIQSLGHNNYTTTTDNCHFALCESCFWSATIFKSATSEYKTMHVLYASMTIVSH
jgi:hypothetical protein